VILTSRSPRGEATKRKEKQQKLNESLHFLNMKDEEKNRKLEEGCIVPL